MKKKFLTMAFALCLFVPSLALFTGCSCSDSSSAVVTMDINPSVEFVIDSNNKVVAVNAKNDDADTLLVNAQIIGLDIESAVNVVIENCVITGKLSIEDGNININIVSNSSELQNKIETKIDNAINEVKESLDATFTKVITKVETGSDKAKQELKKTLKFLAPELSEEELSKMTDEQILELIKTKSENYKDLTYAELNNINSFFAKTFQNGIEAARKTIADLKASIENSSILTEEQKAEINKQITEAEKEIDKLVNEFIKAKDEMIAEFKATINEIKTKLKDAYKAQVNATQEALKTSLKNKLDANLITQEQYNEWIALIDNASK